MMIVILEIGFIAVIIIIWLGLMWWLICSCVAAYLAWRALRTARQQSAEVECDGIRRG
jgi:membrane protein implicated in regulation of membrane protease activity